jgi:hypothetical protein
MLVAKVWRITLVLEDGRRIKPSGAGLHDSTGKDWPKNSVLIVPFQRSNDVLDHPDKESAQWSRTPSSVHVGSVDTPTKDIAQWERIGCVEKIDYTRYGEHASNYTHSFDGHGDKGGDGPMASLLLFETGIPHPVLYSLSGKYRMELPSGFVFNWRGFVWP